jgi:hypothetical protein
MTTAKSKTLSPHAALVKGGLLTFLAPKMAQDAKVSFNPILSGINARNYAAKKATVLSGLEQALKGKLAADAKLDGLSELLDAFGEVREPGFAMDEESKSAKENEEGEEDEDALDKKAKDKRAKDKKAYDEFRENMKAKGAADEDLEAMDAMFGAKDESEEDEAREAEDEEDDDEKKPAFLKDKKAKDKRAKDKKAKDSSEEGDQPKEKTGAVDKHAMDAAITSAVAKAEQRTIARINAIHEAKDAVKPWVGKLDMAFDSAADVYKAALETLGEDIDGVHPSAYATILRHIPQPGSKTKTAVFAQDAAGDEFLKKHCPDALSIGLNA